MEVLRPEIQDALKMIEFANFCDTLKPFWRDLKYDTRLDIRIKIMETWGEEYTNHMDLKGMPLSWPE